MSVIIYKDVLKPRQGMGSITEVWLEELVCIDFVKYNQDRAVVDCLHFDVLSTYSLTGGFQCGIF